MARNDGWRIGRYLLDFSHLRSLGHRATYLVAEFTSLDGGRNALTDQQGFSGHLQTDRDTQSRPAWLGWPLSMLAFRWPLLDVLGSDLVATLRAFNPVVS